MKSFEYAAPRSLENALALLGQAWGETEILAGGTDLVTALKQRIVAPNLVVSLKQISELNGINSEGSTLRIGAMTPLADVAAHPVVQKSFPSIVTAIEGIGSAQIANAGTAGGDLCQRPRCWYFRNGFGLLARQGDNPLVPDGDNRYHAIFGNEGPAYFVSPSSLGPALIALDALVVAAGAGKKRREIPATEFFRTPKSEEERETALKPSEILTEIRIPLKGLKNSTYEVRHRDGLDWPYVTASVAFKNESGSISDARVVLGHVAPVPWISAEAGKALNGAKAGADAALKCGQAAASGAKPLSGNKYKVALVKAAVKRAVLAAAGITSEV